MELREDLSTWSGKSNSAISEIYARHHEEPNYLARLVGLISQQDTERGASWLLKHHFDQGGGSLPTPIVYKVYSSLPTLGHWEAKLHILQCMEHLPIPEAHRDTVEQFLKTEMLAERTLVRAWSYYALALFTQRFPENLEESYDLLEQKVLVETAGSVRVRLRKALDKLSRLTAV
ncbi:hypothetical protein SAMN04515695_3617 [Pseudovibrio sp. Tun.PSC04-5.I4]|nr:hypothetical protein SAMN04515695_3617 [Pseudovibrio sp. Tun.PSC04-5.I4]